MSGFSESSRLVLVEVSGMIYRAFHQVPQDGFVDYDDYSSVRRFCRTLENMARERFGSFRPTHVGIVFDAARRSFRHDIYPAYKANRKETPAGLAHVMPYFRDAVRALGFTPIEEEEYEADDLIASYARRAEQDGAEVAIVSGDKDFMQLVGPAISIFNPTRKEDPKWIDADEVERFFLVPPSQVVEVQALAGDSADNIPGVPGVGIKTAAPLILAFGTAEGVIRAAAAGQVTNNRLRGKILAHQDDIRIARRLVRLADDVMLPVPPSALAFDYVRGEDARAFLFSLGKQEAF